MEKITKSDLDAQIRKYFSLKKIKFACLVSQVSTKDIIILLEMKSDFYGFPNSGKNSYLFNEIVMFMVKETLFVGDWNIIYLIESLLSIPCYATKIGKI